MKLEHSLMPYTKIGSKWIEDLKVKFLEENIDRMLFDINCSNIFLDAIPRVMKIKTIINKWNLVELTQKLLYSKGNCKKKKNTQKASTQNGRKYLQTMQPTRALSPECTSSSFSSKSKKANNPIKKWAEDINGHFSKEDI